MKNIKQKTIIMILAIFFIVATININKVQAYDGEIDEISDEEIVNEEWKNAQFSLKKDGISNSILEISDVTPKDDTTYYLFITSNSEKPNVTSQSDEGIGLTYDENSKVFKAMRGLEKYIEKNQDLYATVLEHKFPEDDNIVIYGKKLDRYEEPKYNDAFYATFMTNDGDQIITSFTHSSENNRKIQIKIGKITDTSILQKIKNQDANGFANLLSYAKSNSGIYDQMLNSTTNGNNIEYRAGDAGFGESVKNNVIDLKNIENEAYYYLYVKTDDENGKYISNEAVTLARTNVYDNNVWYMFFYGSSDFKWENLGNINQGINDNYDNTMATTILPRTGIYSYVICGIVVLAVVGVISYKIYKKYNF